MAQTEKGEWGGQGHNQECRSRRSRGILGYCCPGHLFSFLFFSYLIKRVHSCTHTCMNDSIFTSISLISFPYHIVCLWVFSFLHRHRHRRHVYLCFLALRSS